MARAFAKVKATVWQDDDWKQLHPLEQWGYTLLLSQPAINNCGVLPYVVTRWARLAVGIDLDQVRQIMLGLEARSFVVVDEETAEVLVRSFIKHDEVEKQPNLVKAAKRQYLEVQSPRIRATLHREYPHLFDAVNGDASALASKPLSKPLPEPLSEGVSKGLDKPFLEGVPEPVPDPRGRARDQHPLDGSPKPASGNQHPATPTSSSSPRQEPAADDDEMTSITPAIIEAAMQVEPTSSSITDDDGPTSKLWDELKALRPTDDQTNVWYHAVQEEPERVKAIVAYAKRRGKSIPGTIDHLIRNGSWPESARDPDVASGAKGTRSHDRATDHPCPHCGIGFKTQAGLAEHNERQHTEIEVAPPTPDALKLALRATPASTEPPAPRRGEPPAPPSRAHESQPEEDTDAA